MAGPGLGDELLNRAVCGRHAWRGRAHQKEPPHGTYWTWRSNHQGAMEQDRCRATCPNRCGRTCARVPREGRTGGGDDRSRPRRPAASPPSAAVTERRGARVPARAAVARGGARSDWAKRRARLYSRNSSIRFLGSFSRRYSK